MIKRFLIQEHNHPGLQPTADLQIFPFVAELRVADGRQHFVVGVSLPLLPLLYSAISCGEAGTEEMDSMRPGNWPNLSEGKAS